MVADQILMLGQQGPEFDWSGLLYLLIFLVFPALGALGEWIRKHFAKKEEEEVEVIVEEDKPAPAHRSEPLHRPQTLAGAPPVRQAPPPRGVSTTMPPVARPMAAPQPAPARPVVPRPRPTRPVPQRPVRPQRLAPSLYEAQYDVVYDADYKVEYKADYDAGYSERVKPHAAEMETTLEKRRAPVRGRALLQGGPLDGPAMRRAVMLSEILSPPVALRTRSNTPFARLEA
jgi:hypothetical protein